MVSYSFFYPASHSIHTETYQFYCCCYCFSDACYRVTHQSCKLHICGSTSRSGKIERERLPNRSHWQCFERGKYPFHQINCWFYHLYRRISWSQSQTHHLRHLNRSFWRYSRIPQSKQSIWSVDKAVIWQIFFKSMVRSRRRKMHRYISRGKKSWFAGGSALQSRNRYHGSGSNVKIREASEDGSLWVQLLQPVQISIKSDLVVRTHLWNPHGTSWTLQERQKKSLRYPSH